MEKTGKRPPDPGSTPGASTKLTGRKDTRGARPAGSKPPRVAAASQTPIGAEECKGCGHSWEQHGRTLGCLAVPKPGYPRVGNQCPCTHVRGSRLRTPDDAAPDRVIERESNGPHVAPCSCDESLALRRRLRAAEKLIGDALFQARFCEEYFAQDQNAVAVARDYQTHVMQALRALRGEL